MEDKLLDALQRDIKLLESWVRGSISGGWSTHLNEPMKKRINELKALVYDVKLGK